MKILILDNYDSFTYNLFHYVTQVTDHQVDVRRNDAITVDEVGGYDKLILSPGPGLPDQAGILMNVLKKYAATVPILGVCLGHQAIALSLGGSLRNLEEVSHGKSCPVYAIPGEALFAGLPVPFDAGIYHSWVVDDAGLPECLIPTARNEAGHIMALRHHSWNLAGVQFHPESILTPHGLQIIRNWIRS